jgi:hypothetical protein
MKKADWEGKEDAVIYILMSMLKDGDWTQEEIDRYVLARID